MLNGTRAALQTIFSHRTRTTCGSTCWEQGRLARPAPLGPLPPRTCNGTEHNYSTCTHRPLQGDTKVSRALTGSSCTSAPLKQFRAGNPTSRPPPVSCPNTEHAQKAQSTRAGKIQSNALTIIGLGGN